MKIETEYLKECLIIEPQIFSDERGFFFETYSKERYKKILGNDISFVQDNFSKSSLGVLRGIHFQVDKPQGKLVYVTKGEVFDVAVDLRKGSKTFGKWKSVILNEQNKKQFWIPAGFGHAFQALTSEVHFQYKCTDYYDPKSERTIIWNDKNLDIKWPSNNQIVSNKDMDGMTLEEYLM